MPVNAAGLRRFWDPQRNCYQVQIAAGDVYVSGEAEVIGTVLGSCIAVCAYDAVSQVGGMNHFMLPGHQTLQEDQDAHRYGSYAMELLINDLMKHGCRRERLRFKLAGGADMLAGLSSVGTENIGFIRDYLTVERFAVESADLGGEQARKLIFSPCDGRLFIKRVSRIESPLGQEERALRDRLADQLHKPQDDVELF